MSKTSADPVALVASPGPSPSPVGAAVAVIVATLADGSEVAITDPSQIQVVDGLVTGIPHNSSAIISQTDGIPVTVGQALSLRAVAAGANGEDLSGQITWKSNQVTDPLGQGSSVSYTPNTVAMETVTAEIASTGLKTRASFTVSTADVTVAPHVKVLPDPTELVEQSAGVVKLTQDPALPTIRVGDVVIGAAGQVDPAKVVSRSQTGSTLTLQTAPALPKEVIEFGTATFEQQVDWSGDSGEVTIVDIPPEPFHLADILTPKWTGFVRGGDPIQKSLKVLGKGTVNWHPLYSGNIEFDRQVDNGIKSAQIQHTGKFSSSIELNGQGFFQWWGGASPVTVLPLQKKKLFAVVGPIKMPIQMEVSGSMIVTPAATINHHVQLSALVSEAQLTENLEYSEYGWKANSLLDGGQKSGLVQQGSGLLGSMIITYEHRMRILLPDGNTSSTELDIQPFVFGSLNGVNVSTMNGPSDSIVNGQSNIGIALTVNYGSSNSIASNLSRNTMAIPIVISAYIAYFIAIAYIESLPPDYQPGQVLIDLSNHLLQTLSQALSDQVLDSQESDQIQNSTFDLYSALNQEQKQTLTIPSGTELQILVDHLERCYQQPCEEEERPRAPFPIPTSQCTPKACDPVEFLAWAQTFAFPAPGGSNPPIPDWKLYESRVCGNTQYAVQGGGQTINADGIDVSSCRLLDCKYSNVQDRNALLIKCSPDFIIDDYLGKEFRRYNAVISDPNTPAIGLDLRTNTPLNIDCINKWLGLNPVSNVNTNVIP